MQDIQSCLTASQADQATAQPCRIGNLEVIPFEGAPRQSGGRGDAQSSSCVVKGGPLSPPQSLRAKNVSSWVWLLVLAAAAGVLLPRPSHAARRVPYNVIDKSLCFLRAPPAMTVRPPSHISGSTERGAGREGGVCGAPFKCGSAALLCCCQDAAGFPCFGPLASAEARPRHVQATPRDHSVLGREHWPVQLGMEWAR